MFLILFDLLFEMQEKSRRSISKKGRNARFLMSVLTIKKFVQLLGGASFQMNGTW